MKQARPVKFAVVAAFTACWWISAVVRTRFAGLGTDLDASWLIGLASSFQRGLVSGRDLHFTYGPAAQILAWLGTTLTTSKSAFDAYHMIALLYSTACAAAIAVVFMLYDRLSWKQTAVVYPVILLLNLFSEIPSVRLTLLLLCTALAYRLIMVQFARRQWIYAGVLGGFCFVCQLFSLDIGIYGCATVLVTLVADYLLERKTTALTAAAIFLATLGCLNLAIDVFFKWTSSQYHRLFDYQLYALETMRGYSNTLGTEWQLDRFRTTVLVVTLLYTLIIASLAARRAATLDRCLLAGLIFVSLVSLKSALIRSDLGHIAYAAVPLIFTFLLLGKSEWNWRAGQVVWCALAAVLFWVMPSAGWSMAVEVWRVASGQYSMKEMLHQTSSFVAPVEFAVPPQLLSPEFRSRSTPVVPFPYENYIVAALHRPLLAPVLQSYSASTPELQRFYIDALERQRPQGIDVVYGADQTAVWPVDGVQTITRVPLIFEYLYRNFELASAEESLDGHYILAARHTPRDIVIRDLPVTRQQWSNSTGMVRLSAPVACGVVRAELMITSSFRKYLFRPSGVDLTFRNGEEPLLTARVRPIELDRPFTTDISLLPPTNFQRVFGPNLIPARTWDNVVYDRSPTDKLAARPRAVQLRKLECIDPQRFVEADTDIEAFDVTALFPPEILSGAVRGGYAVVTPESAGVPQVVARIGAAGSTRNFRDVLVTKPAASYRMPSAFTDGLGIAMMNPQAKPIQVEVKYDSPPNAQKATITLEPRRQTAKFLPDLLNLPGTGSSSGTVTFTSNASFSLFAAQFGTAQFTVPPIEVSMVHENGSLVFPQFVIQGGWATAFILSNPAATNVTGRIDIFSPDGEPMRVTMNGETSSTFRYSIPPGKAYALWPGAPGGKHVE